MKNPFRPFTTAIVLLAGSIIAGCQGPGNVHSLMTGDLVFVGLPKDYDTAEDTAQGAISASTGEAAHTGDGLNIIHVAIAEIASDSVWIIDATIRRGVDRHPLDTFLTDFTLKDGSYPVFIVKRLRDNRMAERFVQNAKQYLGQPYDVWFMPGNEALYCSELVRDSYRPTDGEYLFDAKPMNFKNSDGEFPLYWQQLFGRLGQPIPQDVPGTNPQDMMASPLLTDTHVRIPLRNRDII